MLLKIIVSENNHTQDFDLSCVTEFIYEVSILISYATSKRVRNEPRTTLRRRTSTRSRGASTARRMSTNIHDTAVAMLPDLSENLSNEERTWEEIMQIKAMPICMAQKMQLKNQLQSATKLRLQGFEQLKWRRRKAWQQFRIRVKETYSKMELWTTSLKKIGGNFGVGIVAYFLFIKWLLFLNAAIFSIIFSFVILPTIVLEKPEIELCTINSSYSISCCSEMYSNVSNESNSIDNSMQDSSFLENTLLFYGMYTHQIHGVNGSDIYYNLPLAYICSIIAILILSLVVIVRSAAKGFKERVVEGEGQIYQYCNLVFGGWDYCINNEKSASIKHKAVYNEIKTLLESERLEEERQNCTREEKTKLFFIRLIINILIVSILGTCGLFIYYVTTSSFNRVSPPIFISDYDMTYISFGRIIQLVIEFLPYICIVGLNIMVPFLLRYLVTLEKYSAPFLVKVTVLRTILLRYISLVMLLTSLYKFISDTLDENECINITNSRLLCWETFAGQQFFKLYITDFFAQFFVTFFINFPRSLIARHTENKLIRFLGEQEFDLSKHVIDVVYSQTVCWLGTFFAPLLPLIAIIALFLLFYIKKFTFLVNSTPSNQVYRASRSNLLFMSILLVSYIFIMIPLGFIIVELIPSKSCGPFRGLSSAWSLLISTFSHFPDWLQSFLYFLGTAGFGVPAFVILLLLLYYYYAVSVANKHMVTVLKNQLILEGHDKQFLLNRLSAFIKQQQEQVKYHQDQTHDLGTFT
ncbi:transmembrane channel-like protein 7 isoform X2 [Orussus abietinus]|uniref:transmembrane channel-like protein 7 isoform X2 n=1 Tax=Orussus abietinus TaxID=222816 RepID=UPI0006268714|nr:transmembrane channel-like protein 7 isoform X2 [Orussus abietinus]